MYQHPEYKLSLANPYRILTIRSARVRSDVEALDEYARIAILCFYDALEEQGGGTENIDETDLRQRLLDLRLHGAISLQKMNPLYLIVGSACKGKSVSEPKYKGVQGVLSDLNPENPALGRFRVNRIRCDNLEILVNALYVDSYGGLDKAKEWAARGRTALYRIKEGKTGPSNRHLIFVADGPWKPEGIAKLRASGWRVCRLNEFPDILDSVLSASESVN